MTVRSHIYSSAALAALLLSISHSLQMALTCLLAGILIDLDHVFDFLFFSKEKLSVRSVFLWCNQAKWQKVTLIFHSYELFFVLAVAVFYFPNAVLMGFLFGMGLHLLLDQFGNRYFNKIFRLNLFFYFMIYRTLKGFKKENMLKMLENAND